MLAETFWELFRSIGHWEFEIFLMLLFDVVIGALLWPAIKIWIRNHDIIHHDHDCENSDDH